MTAAQEAEISDYAMREALRATYRDYNALAAALNRFKRSGKVQSLIGEGLVPFTKTPLNILKRGEIDVAYDYATQVAKSQVSGYKPAKWVTELKGSKVNKGLYSVLKARTSGIENAFDSTTGETIDNTGSLKKKDIIDRTSANQGVKAKLYEMLGINKTVREGGVTWDDIDQSNLTWDKNGLKEIKVRGNAEDWEKLGVDTDLARPGLEHS